MLATGVVSSRRNDQSGRLPKDHEARTIARIERIQRQLVSIQKVGDLLEESRLCNNIAALYEEISDWQHALEFHQYDCQLSEAAGDFDGLAMALENIAKIFQT